MTDGGSERLQTHTTRVPTPASRMLSVADVGRRSEAQSMRRVLPTNQQWEMKLPAGMENHLQVNLPK